MKTDMLRRGRTALMGLALMTGLLAAPALAQFPGGGGGPQGRFPFAVGSVSTVDSGAGTITLTSQFGGGAQTIKVGSGAQIVTLTTIAVTDLKVGDKIAVQGVPTGITTSAITAGDPPAGLPGMGGGPRGGNGGQTAGANTAGTAAAQSFATATGTIKVLPTTTDPHLTLSLGTDTQLFLKIANGAKVSKYNSLTLADLKSGDQIMAAGQFGADGVLTVTTVAVNLPQRGGPGGFGGPGRPNGNQGGGGFGGPGGPPPGAPNDAPPTQ